MMVVIILSISLRSGPQSPSASSLEQFKSSLPSAFQRLRKNSVKPNSQSSKNLRNSSNDPLLQIPPPPDGAGAKASSPRSTSRTSAGAPGGTSASLRLLQAARSRRFSTDSSASIDDDAESSDASTADSKIKPLPKVNKVRQRAPSKPPKRISSSSSSSTSGDKPPFANGTASSPSSSSSPTSPSASKRGPRPPQEPIPESIRAAHGLPQMSPNSTLQRTRQLARKAQAQAQAHASSSTQKSIRTLDTTTTRSSSTSSLRALQRSKTATGRITTPSTKRQVVSKTHQRRKSEVRGRKSRSTSKSKTMPRPKSHTGDDRPQKSEKSDTVASSGASTPVESSSAVDETKVQDSERLTFGEMMREESTNPAELDGLDSPSLTALSPAPGSNTVSPDLSVGDPASTLSTRAQSLVDSLISDNAADKAVAQAETAFATFSADTDTKGWLPGATDDSEPEDGQDAAYEPPADVLVSVTPPPAEDSSQLFTEDEVFGQIFTAEGAKRESMSRSRSSSVSVSESKSASEKTKNTSSKKPKVRKSKKSQDTTTQNVELQSKDPVSVDDDDFEELGAQSAVGDNTAAETPNASEDAGEDGASNITDSGHPLSEDSLSRISTPERAGTPLSTPSPRSLLKPKTTIDRHQKKLEKAKEKKKAIETEREKLRAQKAEENARREAAKQKLIEEEERQKAEEEEREKQKQREIEERRSRAENLLTNLMGD